MRCDVAVVGAGAAGIAAAVAAAKAGAEVVLVERQDVTGGLATSAWVGTLCGLYYRNLTSARYAVQGFAREFASAVGVKSQTHTTMFAEGLHFLPYKPAILHQEAIRQLQQAKVHLMLQSQVTAVQTDAQHINALKLQTANTTVNLVPSAVIDCSGTAQISHLSAVDTIKQSHYQAGAFVFQVSGLPIMTPDVLALNLIRWLKRGIEKGALLPPCARLSIIPGSLKQGTALLKLGMSGLFDGSPACLNHYALEARTNSRAIVDYLKHNEPLLAKLSITAMAKEVGMRSGERSQGIALLDEIHVLTCAKPDDGVAIGTWPIEYWGLERKPEMRYFALDDAYWITAGMLVSRHFSNLFFAGRGFSATEAAMASARVIGTCLSTGYAAGGLAAEFAATGIWQTAISKIRQQQLFTEDA